MMYGKTTARRRLHGHSCVFPHQAVKQQPYVKQRLVVGESEGAREGAGLAEAVRAAISRHTSCAFFDAGLLNVKARPLSRREGSGGIDLFVHVPDAVEEAEARRKAKARRTVEAEAVEGGGGEGGGGEASEGGGGQGGRGQGGSGEGGEYAPATRHVHVLGAVEAVLAGFASDPIAASAMLGAQIHSASQPQVCLGRFGEDAIRAAFDAFRVVFVGPSGQATRLERAALRIPDFRLRPVVLFNFLTLRAELHGDEPPPDMARMRQMLADYDVRAELRRRTSHIESDELEIANQASDVAAVRGNAQPEPTHTLMDHVGVFEHQEQGMQAVIDGLAAAVDRTLVWELHLSPCSADQRTELDALCQDAAEVSAYGSHYDETADCLSAHLILCQGRRAEWLAGRVRGSLPGDWRPAQASVQKGRQLCRQHQDDGGECGGCCGDEGGTDANSLDGFSTGTADDGSFGGDESAESGESVPHAHSSSSRLALARGRDALDDYTSQPEVLYDAWWPIFLLRRGLPPGAPLSKHKLRHLVLYFDCRAAHDMPLLFHLANVVMRHSVNSAVGVRVKRDPESFARFTELTNDESFLETLAVARAHPTSKEAREVTAKLINLINLTGKAVPWGSQERAAEVTRYMAMHRSEGPGSIFYSMAPDDVHNPLCIQLAHAYVGPDIFPAVAGAEFKRGLQCLRKKDAASTPVEDGEAVPTDDGNGGEIRVALEEAALQRLASNNPIATTHAFSQLLNNVRTNLIGLSPARLTNVPLHRRRKHMWGVNACHRDVKECNDRASLHVHGLAHGGLTPALLADVAADGELRAHAMAALDTQLKAELPLEYHAVYLAQQVLHVRKRRDVAHDVPAPPATSDEFEAGKETSDEIKQLDGSKYKDYEHYLKGWATDFHTRHPAAARFATIANGSPNARGRASIERLQYDDCRDEIWWPTFEHHARVVVLNKHSHEHCKSCTKTDRGKIQCRFCAPWPHDVESTYCAELRKKPSGAADGEPRGEAWSDGEPAGAGGGEGDDGGEEQGGEGDDSEMEAGSEMETEADDGEETDSETESETDIDGESEAGSSAADMDVHEEAEGAEGMDDSVDPSTQEVSRHQSRTEPELPELADYKLPALRCEVCHADGETCEVSRRAACACSNEKCRSKAEDERRQLHYDVVQPAEGPKRRMRKLDMRALAVELQRRRLPTADDVERCKHCKQLCRGGLCVCRPEGRSAAGPAGVHRLSNFVAGIERELQPAGEEGGREGSSAGLGAGLDEVDEEMEAEMDGEMGGETDADEQEVGGEETDEMEVEGETDEEMDADEQEVGGEETDEMEVEEPGGRDDATEAGAANNELAELVRLATQKKHAVLFANKHGYDTWPLPCNQDAAACAETVARARATLRRLVARGQPLRNVLDSGDFADGLWDEIQKCLRESEQSSEDADGAVARHENAQHKSLDPLFDLLRSWTYASASEAMACRNGLVADYCEVLAGCVRGNAVPYSLGGGAGSKAGAMYQIKCARYRTTAEEVAAGCRRLGLTFAARWVWQVREQGERADLRKRNGARRCASPRARRPDQVVSGGCGPAGAHGEALPAARDQRVEHGAGSDAGGERRAGHPVCERVARPIVPWRVGRGGAGTHRGHVHVGHRELESHGGRACVRV